MASWKSVLRTVALASLLVLSAPFAHAQTGDAAQMEKVVKWLRVTGKPVNIGNLIAQDLSLGKKVIPAQGRDFTDVHGTQHVAAIPVDAKKHFVFFALIYSKEERYVWRATEKGELVASIRITKGIQRKVANKKYAPAFKMLKEFIFENADLK